MDNPTRIEQQYRIIRDRVWNGEVPLLDLIIEKDKEGSQGYAFFQYMAWEDHFLRARMKEKILDNQEGIEVL